MPRKCNSFFNCFSFQLKWAKTGTVQVLFFRLSLQQQGIKYGSNTYSSHSHNHDPAAEWSDYSFKLASLAMQSEMRLAGWAKQPNVPNTLDPMVS
jgi:hypothetical protein